MSNLTPLRDQIERLDLMLARRDTIPDGGEKAEKLRNKLYLDYERKLQAAGSDGGGGDEEDMGTGDGGGDEKVMEEGSDGGKGNEADANHGGEIGGFGRGLGERIGYQLGRGLGSGKRIFVEQHKLGRGIFTVRAKGRDDVIATKSLILGDCVYGERVISKQDEQGMRHEYRAWDPFNSVLGAAIYSGIEDIFIDRDSRVLYLGSSTIPVVSIVSISHISDLVGPNGMVFAVGFPHQNELLIDLDDMRVKRNNVTPIAGDPSDLNIYADIVDGLVDVIVCELAQPDQVEILARTATLYLKPGGHFLMSVRANNLFPGVPSHKVFAYAAKRLQRAMLYPSFQLSLKPYDDEDHVCISGASLKAPVTKCSNPGF